MRRSVIAFAIIVGCLLAAACTAPSGGAGGSPAASAAPAPAASAAPSVVAPAY
jgi:hypothetical protein